VEEVGLLLERLKNPARLIVMIGVTLGLRIGEILGLSVEDFDRGTLHVRRSWCRGHEGGTKNGKDREIPVPPCLGQALEEYRRELPPSGWLFVGAGGKPLSDRNLIQRHIYPIAQELGIPHFSLHSLRHTFSTLGGNEGIIPALVVKQLLGHSRLSTTDRYMHDLAGPKREAVEKIENLILFQHKKASGE
jgi:integrase